MIPRHLFLVLAAGASAAAPAAAQEAVFNRTATFPVTLNLSAGADPLTETVAEIITATEDGNTLIYSDAARGGVGFVDITDPANPRAGGFVDVGGSPTTTVVLGSTAYVGVVTSKSFTEPSGHLTSIDLASKSVTGMCDLGGQPDAVAKSPDGRFLAVAIENERDEDVNDGHIPQLPAGNLTVLRIENGAPDCASKTIVDLTGLAEIAPEDPEPEYVDINAANEAVVTLQENNHIAVVDLETGRVTAHFSAGTVDLVNIDRTRDGVIRPTESAMGVKREPDAVQWLDNDRFVMANEGDYQGGARGFTIFNKNGTVEHESGASFEHMVVRLGHYPDKRNAKGNEPEGMEVGRFGDETLIFVGSERGSVVGVYRDRGAGEAPEFLQMLPAGVGPEGLLALPERSLFVVANETDLGDDGGPRAHVMIYTRAPGDVSYPTILSEDAAGVPQGWGALSGLAAHASDAGRLYAVSDSFYSEARIFEIDATKTPAVITRTLTVTKDGAPVPLLDLEGIALAADGGFWLASEGNMEREKNKTQNLLLKVSAEGVLEQEIALPEALAAQAIRYGFEGVTVSGEGAGETVWIAVQREWKDDPKGFVKLLAYRPSDASWGAVHYPLDGSEEGWAGLSEITASNGQLFIIERDNLVGSAARLKKLYAVPLDGLSPAPLGGELPRAGKVLARDLMPELRATNGYVLDKVEGFTVDADGAAFMVTDNDGVDGSSGETQFRRLGMIQASN